MEKTVNKVTLLGRLGADPELRYISSGTAICNFAIATSRSWKGKDDNWNEKTTWHKVVAWGALGEKCHEWLVKGQQVYVEGRIETRSWEDKDGERRWITEVVAENVIFLGKPKSERTSEESDRGDGKEYGDSPFDDDIPF